VLVLREFNPHRRLIAFDFLQPKSLYGTLVLTGFLYNLGIWADKLMFWAYPDTSQVIIGGLRASLIYDIPVFLSYLSIIPGMAVFLVRIETDFVEYYDKFFTAVRQGGSWKKSTPCAMKWPMPSRAAWAKSPRSDPGRAGDLCRRTGSLAPAGHFRALPAPAACAGGGGCAAGGADGRAERVFLPG
jgi:hypothetical protein